jgi:hypothetical protein
MILTCVYRTLIRRVDTMIMYDERRSANEGTLNPNRDSVRSTNAVAISQFNGVCTCLRSMNIQSQSQTFVNDVVHAKEDLSERNFLLHDPAHAHQ